MNVPSVLSVKRVGELALNGVYPPVIQRPAKLKGGTCQLKLNPTTTPPVSA